MSSQRAVQIIYRRHGLLLIRGIGRTEVSDQILYLIPFHRIVAKLLIAFLGKSLRYVVIGRGSEAVRGELSRADTSRTTIRPPGFLILLL